MIGRLRREWQGFRNGLRRLDTQATVVLVAAVVLAAIVAVCAAF